MYLQRFPMPSAFIQCRARSARFQSLLVAFCLWGCSLHLATWLTAQTPPAVVTPKKPDITVSTQSAAPVRNIRFQFDGIPYTDVIERFAQMSGKPLIADTNVIGSLTYNDPNPYSYDEAIDTLNLMLAMKGVMLVEAGNNLRLVPFKQLPAMPIRILRGTDPTGDARPGEVVTVVLSVNNLDLKEVADSVTPMLSNAGSVAPLSRGKGLIVTDRLANIQRVRTLLATIDVATAADRQMKTYTLLNASGAIVADLLNRTFGVSTAPKRTTFNPNTKAIEVLPPDPNDYITAVYDEASRTLVLFGPNERLVLAEELINRFEQKEGSGGDVRIYFPQTIKAEELASMIRQAIPGVAAPNEAGNTAATKARVIVDATQNRLIVAAPIPGQLEQIETLINRVDKSVHGQSGINPGLVPLRSQTIQLTKIFRPRATEATNVANIITQALTRRGPGGGVMTTASVSFDAGSQSVVVSGSPADIQVASDIVSQLETGTTQPTAMKTKFIEVGTPAEARRLLPIVEQLYRNQVSDGSLGATAHAKILADTESGRLIVTASEDHIVRVETLITQLRADKSQPQPRRLQIIPIRNARVESALTSIQNLLTERMSERRFNNVAKPALIADAPNNRILVTATEDQLKEIVEIVQVVDIQPETSRRDMRVVALKVKTATELIPVVTQMLEQTTPPGTNPQLAPRLLADPSGRQLIVLALATDFERVEKLIQQFDTSPATTAPRQFRGIELFSRTAAELTTLVQQLYQEQLRGQPEPAGGAATLLAETKNNRIMVSGSDAEITRVELIIRQLDPAERRAAKEETRVFRLKTASAAELSGIVEKSMNAQAQQIRVMVDNRSNSLILSGDVQSVEAATQIIQQLDTRAESGPREIRVLELKSADAATISPMVNNLFTEMIKDQRGSEYVSSTKIVPDTTGNRLVVTGTRVEIDQVSSLVQKLDNAPEQAPGARVFKLNQADAIVMAPIVTSAMMRYDPRGQPIRRVTVTADDKSNSLIVSGTRADLQDAESVIEKLDGETSTKERILRIFDVTSDPDALAAMTLRVFAAQNPGRNTSNLLSITPEPSGKRLIVLAPMHMMAQIETVITSLDGKPDQGVRELHSVELKNATANELLGKVTQLYAEQSQGKTIRPATILSDNSGTRFLVQGTKEQATAIRQIVETLESQTRAPRGTRILELGRLSEVTRVMPLAQQLYRDRLASNPQLGAADAQLVSDGKTGRLIISARTDQLETIQEIVSQLQASGGTNQAPRETRTLEVGTASEVQRLTPLIQQLYQDQWKDRVESDPADAQIMPDPRGGRIIVTGKPDHLKQIEAIVQRLGGGGKAKPEARNTRILDLTTASAVELATTVRTLYLEQAKNRLGNNPPDTLISPDAGGNRLILVSDDTELDAIEELVKKLDKVSSQSASARVFKIKSADPDKVAEILTTSLVRYDAYGRPQKRATVSVDSKTRTLIVTGDPKELQGVASIIEQLDQSLGAQPERKMRVIALKQGKSTTLTPKVRQLYNDRIKSQPELATSDLLIMDESDSNQLILAGTEAQLAVADQIIQELQSAQIGQKQRETKMIEMGTAEELRRLLPLAQQLYKDHWKSRDAGDPADAQFISDANNARLIVTARTNHLAEIESILALLRGDKSQADPRDTRIFDLSTANAAELVTTLRTLYQEQAKNRPGAPAEDTLILPDSGANRVIVTGATAELTVVEEIIKKLDKVGTQSASARVFKIKSAEPEKVAEILTSSLVRYDAYGRAQKRATVSVDAKTRTIIVTGDPKELSSVAAIIEQLDQSLGDQPERKMRVVALKQGKSATITPKVRQLYNDRIKTQPGLATSELLILDETDSNQLILAGNDAQLEIAEKIIQELQAAQAGQKQRETKMIEMASAEEMTRLLPMVQQLYKDHWKNRDAGDPADASILPDPKNARLIVTARTNHIAEIESILTQLRGNKTAADPRDTRIFDLTTASASELVTTLRTLYQEQAKSRPGAPAEDTLILPDTGANRIIVTAAKGELDIVEEIIKKLDKVGTQSASTRVFKLKSADPDKVVEILGSALVRYDAYGRPQKRVSVVTDAKTRTLIATGDPKELQSASVIIEQLDSTLGTQAGRSMRVLTVKNRRVSELSNKVRQIYLDQAKNQPELGSTDALILEDTPSNQLIIAGTDKQITIIEEIAVVLQKEVGQNGRVVRVLPLDRSSAGNLVTMLSQLYARQVASLDPGDRLVVSAGGNERSLVVDAPQATADKIEQLVRSLDQVETTNQNILQTVRLNKGRAEDLADAVNRVMTNRAGANFGRRVSVTAVSGANSLLINGPTNVVQDVMKIVRELDEESTGGDIEVRIYKLENGNAREVSSVLEELLRNVTRRTRGGEGQSRFQQASISVDERSNSLIVSATPAHFRVVEKILPTLDKAPERSDRDVQFVWLRKARSFDVVLTLENLFEDRPRNERPVFEADSTNNSLTIIARRGDMAQIQDLIGRLDDQSKDSTIQVRLRSLDRVAADQMARMLQNIYPQVVSSTLRLVDRIEMPKGANPPTGPGGLTPQPPAAPAPATAPPANPPPGAAVTPPSTTVAASAPATTTPALQAPAATNSVPEVTIAIDKTANALILAGPAQELDRVERLIADLSLNFYGNESEFRLFPLKDADPVIVARALGELLKQDPVQIPAQGGQPARMVNQQPRITVVAEPRTRSVIVRARPTDFALMESLIKQLDAAGQTSQLDFRVVVLTNAAPDKVLLMVQQLVTQLTVARPGEPITVAAAPRARGILIVARGSMLDQVEKMVHSLDQPAIHVEAEVLMVSLKKASATQLATVLQNMLKPGTQGEFTAEARELQEQVRRLKVTNEQGKTVLLDLSQPIKIAADGAAGGGNRLILTSTPDNLKALAAIAEAMDSPAIAEGVEVRLAVLKYADATTVSQTLTTIFTQGRQLAAGPGGPVTQPEGDSGKALVNPFNVAIDARSNTLIMSGRKETLDLAAKVIGDVDKQLERFVTEVKLFRLKHAAAIRLVPVLQSVFSEGPPVPGTEGLNTQITRLRVLKDNKESTTTLGSKTRAALTIQADDLSNILIVAARSDTLPLIQEVIEQLDIPSASGLETVRIYPLEHSDPAIIQKILNDLYTGQRAGTVRNEDKPVITVDARTSALVVAGNGKSFAMIEGLLKQLDQKLPFELRDIRLVPLQNADANVVAATIQKLMDARITQRAALNQGQADLLKVIVMADQRSNALLVGGSKDSFELVESLAKQLDTANPALSGRVRLIPMQFADARVLASTFTALFEQRYAAARTADVQRQKPIILPDARSNSLLVTANQEDNGAIDDLLKRLDAKQDNPALTLTVLPLKHNDSSRVGTMVESIFAARLRSQVLPGQQPVPSDQIKVEPDALNNALIISASKENLSVIQELVQKLDSEPTIAGGTLESFTLQFADAQRVANILKTLVDQGLYRPGQPPGSPIKGNSSRDLLSISVDPRSNTLIVSASPENLAIVREVIKKVDSKDLAATGDVRLYTLKNAKASSLATVLEQFFRAKRTADSVAVNANERTIPASVIADDRVNTLLVTGGKEAFELVDRILPQLDGEPVFSRLNFRVFPLKRATATKLQSTLTPIFANRPPKVKGEALDPITIVADAWVNALLVGATVDDLATVASLIAQLDAEPSETGIAIHVFPLVKADARRVAQTVQGLFREQGPNQILPISVSADERINAIVVSCGETDAKRIQELVQKLDTEQVARVSEIRVFPLQYAKAESLSTILNTALNTKPTGNLLEQNPNAQSVLQFITRTTEGRELVTAALKEAVLITPEGRMNSLIVSGPVDYMSLIEQIITRLDMSSPQEAKIKVFPLVNADARQMSELLMQLFRMTQVPNSGTQRAITYTLLGPVKDDQGNIVDEQQLGSATVGTAEQNALTVTIDPRTNSLLVGGTDHYVTLVSQIIEQLDESPANERTSEVVRLKNSQALEVATSIRNFLDQERTRVTQVLGAEAIGTAQRLLEREVAVVAEPVSNTLLVSANPRYFVQIRALIDELDKAQPQVLIQVLLAEVTLDSSTDLGVEWTYNGTKGDVKYGVGTDLGVGRKLQDFGGYSTAITGSDFNFMLRALKDQGRLEVLSRPQIVTADNKPAAINIGQRVPLITDSRVTERGDTINSFRYEDVGVNLTVTPKISPDGFVKMEIGTTNSALSSSSVEINKSAIVPIINQRRANTTVSVQSGQTIIIGGLIATLDDTRVKKVPVLGSIPLLGALFRSTSTSRDRKELLILLTPQVLSNPKTAVPLLDLEKITKEQLNNSTFKDSTKRDRLQKLLMDPIWPTNEPPGTVKREPLRL